MAGKFIVVEGPSASGKSSAIIEALKHLERNKFCYVKGFTKTSRWGELINAHPHSWLYCLDFALKTAMHIKPLLKRGINVLQDRYVQSVDTFPPDCYRMHNRIMRSMLNKYFIQPDLYIHITASLDTLVNRLRQGRRDEYHNKLAKDPEMTIERENNYMRIYALLQCPKYVINTTGRAAEESASELVEIIRRELK